MGPRNTLFILALSTLFTIVIIWLVLRHRS
jgi:hypothetical protein